MRERDVGRVFAFRLAAAVVIVNEMAHTYQANDACVMGTVDAP